MTRLMVTVTTIAKVFASTGTGRMGASSTTDSSARTSMTAKEDGRCIQVELFSKFFDCRISRSTPLCLKSRAVLTFLGE